MNNKLPRFVIFTNNGEAKVCQVKFKKKLQFFCQACCRMGHFLEECGAGEHAKSKFEWGPFIMAPRRGKCGGRGLGSAEEGVVDMKI